ncbi:hypothetical protein SETIT_6G169700v2 [Setaria italica]|uniref:Uncharacterized protein n=1 Tax=Setaria italica TaxID=4555 RepID=A0A368RMM3_SETIT|nr:hypothetical protein SETIT_6G169700v2 [Setaria italica]
MQAACYPLAAYAAARYDRARVVAAGAFLWAAATFLVAVSDSFAQGTDLAREQRKGDIMELFSQAQRNILSLNKQRLLAMEELKKLQDENKSLLQEIEVLETEVQGVPLEAVQSSTFCELLLRIDTMVVSGMICRDTR